VSLLDGEKYRVSNCFYIIVCLFVRFLLAIVLSFLLRFANSDCPFGIFKLFLIKWGKKYHHVGTFSKFNRTIVGKGKIDTPSTHIHDLSLSWLGTNTSITGGEVKLLLWDKTLKNHLHILTYHNMFQMIQRSYYRMIGLSTIIRTQSREKCNSNCIFVRTNSIVLPFFMSCNSLIHLVLLHIHL